MEGKGFGQLGSIRQLTAQEMSEAAVRPVLPPPTNFLVPQKLGKETFSNHQQARGRNNDRSLNSNTDSKSRLRTGSLRSSNLTTAINSIPNYGAIIDKVDVFNSVEIRVASAPSNADDALRGYTSKSTSGKDNFLTVLTIYRLTLSTNYRGRSVHFFGRSHFLSDAVKTFYGLFHFNADSLQRLSTFFFSTGVWNLVCCFNICNAFCRLRLHPNKDDQESPKDSTTTTATTM